MNAKQGAFRFLGTYVNSNDCISMSFMSNPVERIEQETSTKSKADIFEPLTKSLGEKRSFNASNLSNFQV